MIIHSLIDYYDAQSKLGIMPPVGWSREKISGAIEIDDDGAILAIHDLHNNFMVRTKSGKEKQLSKPSILTVPQIPIRTVNIAPGFLCDNTKYIFGLEPGKTKKFDKNYKALSQSWILVFMSFDIAESIFMKTRKFRISGMKTSLRQVKERREFVQLLGMKTSLSRHILQ